MKEQTLLCDYIKYAPKKRDSIIEKQSPLKEFHHWLKVPPLYHDWPRSMNNKRVNYLSRIEGKEV